MNGIIRNAVTSACRNHNHRQALVKYTTASTPSTPTKPTPTTESVKDVPGLSKNMVDVPNTEVGPGASKKSVYKNPEYFCYSNTSYFEAEVEMLKYRLPQPSSLKS